MDNIRQAWQYARRYEYKQLLRQACHIKYLGWWCLVAVVLVLAVFLGMYQDQVVAFMGGHAERIRAWPPSWAVAILVLWIFAIPAVLTIGLIWGLLRGAVIVCVGRTTGELWVFLAVRWKFQERARKTEESSLLYACIAEILRGGGLAINTAVRVSFISGHVITILQSLTGVATWVFLLAQVPDLGSQIALVYVGTDSTSTIVSILTYAATLLFSLGALLLLWKPIRSVYPRVKQRLAAPKAADESKTSAIILESDEETTDLDTFLLKRSAEKRHSSPRCLPLAMQDFVDPRLAQGQWRAFFDDLYPDKGEPLNVVVSALSDRSVTRDARGLEDWLSSIQYGVQCLGMHKGKKQQANLGDGNGFVEQAGLVRWTYGLPSHGGTCFESLAGGSHIRYWFQNGPLARTGAVFLAASDEKDAIGAHSIITDGDKIAHLATQPEGTVSPLSGTTYTATAQYVDGLLPSGSAGLNHDVASDGRLAVVRVNVLQHSVDVLPGPTAGCLAAMLAVTALGAALIYWIVRVRANTVMMPSVTDKGDIHKRRHEQLLQEARKLDGLLA
ncbi:hypothetical protein ACM66B_006400 [Microbotryomycetes sp. NB124-2]